MLNVYSAQLWLITQHWKPPNKMNPLINRIPFTGDILVSLLGTVIMKLLSNSEHRVAISFHSHFFIFYRKERRAFDKYLQSKKKIH